MCSKLILLRFGQISGLLPLKFRHTYKKITCSNIPNQDGKIELENSALNLLYSILILIVYIFLTLALFSYDFVNNKDKESNEYESSGDLLALNNIVNKYLFFMLGIIFIVLSIMRKKNFRILFKNFNKFEEQYAKITYFKQQADKNAMKRRCKKTLLFITIGMSLCVLIFIVDVLLTNLLESSQKLLLNFIVFSTIGQFILYLDIIRAEFKKINVFLKESIKEKRFNEGSIKYVQILKNDVIQFVKENHNFENNNKLEQKILAISKCHDTLCDTCQNLNKIYTFQLLCFVTMSFLIILFSIFSNYKLLFNDDMETFGSDLAKNSTMAFFMGSLIIAMLNTTSKTAYEVINKTNRYTY